MNRKIRFRVVIDEIMDGEVASIANCQIITLYNEIDENIQSQWHSELTKATLFALSEKVKETMTEILVD